MPRSFTANFLTQAKSKSARPYQVLEVDWGGSTGTVYYLDRPANSFVTSDGHRLPSSGVDPNVMVVEWPAVTLSLKEGAIGATDQTQVTLDDAGGALTAILNSQEQQRRLVRVWRMFDDPSCVWSTDNGLILAGCLRPFDWTAKDNQLVLKIGDLGPLLAKSISCTATSNVFPNVPNDYQDKNIPLCWGNAQRVEAVLIERPWETHITQNTDGSDPITVTIADDPVDLGVDGSGHTSYPAYLGLDAVTVTFTQSNSPGTGSSTATITKLWDPVLFTAVLLGTVDGAGHSRLIISNEHIWPTAVAGLLGDPTFNLLYAGEEIQIVSQKLGIVGVTLSSFAVDSPWPGWYTLVINDPTGTVVPNLQIGDVFKFLKSGLPMRGWPTGTVLKQQGGQSVYIANALPSKNVARVEGFGSLTDQAGNTRQDFIVLGNYVETIISGSATTKLTGGGLIVNLNDNTWNNPPGTGLGRDVTSITFPGGTPRDLDGNLNDDRIWVTLQGCEDKGDSTGNLITNPALVILQYLEHSALMYVAPSSINLPSFAVAAAALTGYACGFGQIESADGLALLQHIASLCHSVLFFDQGQANLVVLSDTPGTVTAGFDTTTNDNLLQGSLTHSESAVDDVVNEVTMKWRQCWDDQSGQKLLDSKNAKLTSIAAFGRIAKEINPCDIYYNRISVAAERDWWLDHLSSIFRYVRFTGFLDALVLQPGDWISLTWIDGGGRNLFGGAQTMQVTKCTDTGKDGLVEIEARYVQFTY
jgi:hypothetical protein